MDLKQTIIMLYGREVGASTDCIHACRIENYSINFIDHMHKWDAARVNVHKAKIIQLSLILCLYPLTLRAIALNFDKC